MYTWLNTATGSIFFFTALLLFARACYNRQGYILLGIIMVFEALCAWYVSFVSAGILPWFDHFRLIYALLFLAYCYCIVGFVASLQIKPGKDLYYWQYAMIMAFIILTLLYLVIVIGLQMIPQARTVSVLYSLAIIFFIVNIFYLSRQSVLLQEDMKHIRVFLRIFAVGIFLLIPLQFSSIWTEYFPDGKAVAHYMNIISITIWDLGLMWWIISVLLITPFKYFTESPSENKMSEQEKESLSFPKEAMDGILLQQFDDYINRPEVYCDMAINLNAVSYALQVSQQKLSATINQYYDNNFRHILNEVRVRAVVERLKQVARKPNFMAIAFECGFSSKASFNRVFKQHTGLTPTAYYQQLQ